MRNFWRFKKPHIFYLTIIILLGGILRFYGINWDQGFHLHPDERAIVMFTIPLELPGSIDEFLSPQSSWNPHFFAYGNFPLYLLKGVSFFLSDFDPFLSHYEKINLVGRVISATADLGTLILIYLIAKKLFNKTAGLLTAFFYSVSIFPIQTAHFYAVDTLLTFFITLTLYQLIRFYEKPSIKNSVFVGIFFGLSLATKISAIPLLTAIAVAIAADFILLFIKQPHKLHIWFPHVPRFLKRLIFKGAIIIISTIITFTICQPYAVIDFQEFLKQNLLQSQMTHNAFIFPYTLQYVDKIPYIYELKNVFFWGIGPLLSTFSLGGIIYLILNLFRKIKKGNIVKEIIVLTFFFVYFFTVGNFAVGWMRYMLPLYPLFSLFGAVLAYQLFLLLKYYLRNHKTLFITLNSSFIILVLVWPLSFMDIYTKPNTRVSASEWIHQNIPYGSTLAVEHWDDGLPIFGQQNYNILTLELYNQDTPGKWQIINGQLLKTDYILIASNRLYTPLQKLTNCLKLPPAHCYTQTASYYQMLFNGQLGFKKIAEFENPPTIPFLNIKIDDQSADESFTVYDHPKVIIFKKM